MLHYEAMGRSEIVDIYKKNCIGSLIRSNEVIKEYTHIEQLHNIILVYLTVIL